MPLKLRVGWLVVGNEKVASKFEFEIYDGPCDECIFPSSSACDISNIPKSISFREYNFHIFHGSHAIAKVPYNSLDFPLSAHARVRRNATKTI